MGAFFVYLLKSAVCLLLFYPLYKLLLSKETFHRFNRIAVLSIFGMSFILPLTKISFENRIPMNESVRSIEQYIHIALIRQPDPETEEAETVVSRIHICMVFYFIGVLFLLGRIIYSYFHLYGILNKGKRFYHPTGKIIICHPIQHLAPFSWMKYMVISEKDLEENGKVIITHELAHLTNRHTFDLMLADFLIILQWFNPVIWLLKRELQDIHEYEADRAVIKKGNDARQYQLLLIKRAVGTTQYAMANSFNHSNLKKRITMMLKEKSNPWARLKYLSLLPVAALILTAFARPGFSDKTDETTFFNRIVTYENLESQPQEKTVTLQDSVIKREEKTDNYSDSIFPVRSLTQTNPDYPGVGGDNGPLIIMDEVEISNKLFSTITLENIESITVLKDKNATELYGDKGKNGVVIVKSGNLSQRTSVR